MESDWLFNNPVVIDKIVNTIQFISYEKLACGVRKLIYRGRGKLQVDISGVCAMYVFPKGA